MLYNILLINFKNIINCFILILIQINLLIKIKLNNRDSNIIDIFLIDTLNNTNQFNINTFFNLLNQLKLIRYLELNLKYIFIIFMKKESLFNFHIFIVL